MPSRAVFGKPPRQRKIGCNSVCAHGRRIKGSEGELSPCRRRNPSDHSSRSPHVGNLLTKAGQGKSASSTGLIVDS